MAWMVAARESWVPRMPTRRRAGASGRALDDHGHRVRTGRNEGRLDLSTVCHAVNRGSGAAADSEPDIDEPPRRVSADGGHLTGFAASQSA